jgi:hypothetical protein
MNNNENITLSFGNKAEYCTFNLKGEFILCNEVMSYVDMYYHRIIWIYSTQTKNNKWECKRFTGLKIIVIIN